MLTGMVIAMGVTFTGGSSSSEWDASGLPYDATGVSLGSREAGHSISIASFGFGSAGAWMTGSATTAAPRRNPNRRMAWNASATAVGTRNSLFMLASRLRVQKLDDRAGCFLDFPAGFRRETWRQNPDIAARPAA